jgi:hypothetical protein
VTSPNDPAAALGRIVDAALGRGSAEQSAPVADEPSSPRVPAPNLAQGTSGMSGPRWQTDPVEEFTDLIRAKIAASRGLPFRCCVGWG